MPTLNDVLAEHADLDEQAGDWLHRLVGDWQLLSDLSFGDLVLWVRSGPGRWVAAAHVRPTTGVGIFAEDLVGGPVDGDRLEMVERAFAERRPVHNPRPIWLGEAPVREEAIPVVRGGGPVIAVVSRHTSHASMRTPSRLEVTYLATADALARMIGTGEFPTATGHMGRRRGAPRVGDGVLRLDSSATVTYASPNAVSVLHRLGYQGPVVGARLAEELVPLLADYTPMDEDFVPVLSGRVPWATEVVTPDAGMTARSIPLTEGGRRVGAVLLVRDVSELRRREQELLTKDATIREIHHRVKNNLQTVAAVLRLQSRRLGDPQGKAALDDAVRRVATIALVHDTLSQRLEDTIDFSVIAQRGLEAAIDVAHRADTPVRGEVTGEFGVMRSEDATSLAMVLAELVQNAVEHGQTHEESLVRVHGTRDGRRLTVTVTDDGPGLPEGFQPGAGGLGSRIVLSLVEDLRGTIEWRGGQDGGTVVEFTARLRPLDRADARA